MPDSDPTPTDDLGIPPVLDRTQGAKTATQASGPATDAKQTTTPALAATKTSWRDVLPVHPAAELFPLISETDVAAFEELAADIKQHGIRIPIVIWESADDSKPSGLVDGRTRLEAAESENLLDLDENGRLCIRTREGLREVPKKTFSDRPGQIYQIDPYTLALSLNIHRRHLTAGQKRDLIAKLLAADPTRSDRSIATQAKTHHHAVAKVRQEEEGRGNISHVEKRTDTKGREQPASRPKLPAAAPPPLHPSQSAQLRDAAKRAAKRESEALAATPQNKESELLREFARFVVERASVTCTNQKDRDEWRSLLGRVKALLKKGDRHV
jgi:hypothetical protein